MEPVLLCGNPPVRDLGFGRGDLGGWPLGSSGSNPVGPPGPHLTEFDLSIGDLPSPAAAPLVLLDLLMGVRTSNKPELDSSSAAAVSLSTSSSSFTMLTGLLPGEPSVFSAAPDPSSGHKDPSVMVPFSGGGALWSEPAAFPFPAVPTGTVPPNGGIPKGNSPAPLPAATPPAVAVVRTSLELLDLRMGGSPLLLPDSPVPPRPLCPAAAAWWASVAAMGRAERVSGAGEEALVETAAWRARREGSCSLLHLLFFGY